MNSWCTNKFSKIDFGEKRLNQRFIKVAQQIVGSPTRSISESCASWADAKAAYRMFDNRRLSPSLIIGSPRQRTIERVKGKSVVLAVQDSTFLNYERFASIVVMRTMETNSWTQKGLILHPTLAVTL